MANLLLPIYLVFLVCMRTNWVECETSHATLVATEPMDRHRLPSFSVFSCIQFISVTLFHPLHTKLLVLNGSSVMICRMISCSGSCQGPNVEIFWRCYTSSVFMDMDNS